MRLGRILILTAGLALAACVSGGGGSGKSSAAVVPGRGMDPAPCGADRLAHLAGHALTSLPGDEVDGPLRVIRPGDAVTEDLNPRRLNVSLDAQDTIAALSCG